MNLFRRRRVYVDDLPETHDLRFALIFLLVFVVAVGFLYVVGHQVVGNKIPRGTTVAGVDIGGMTTDEAGITLQDKLGDQLERPITLLSGAKKFRIDPQQAGLVFDIDATLADSSNGGSWDPRHLFQVLIGGGKIEPVIEIDETEFDRAARDIADQVQKPPVNSRVEFQAGRPQLLLGSAGRVLDRGRTRTLLLSALLGDRDRLVLPLATVPPAITVAEADAFRRGPASVAVSDPVTLSIGGRELVVSPRAFAPTLIAKPVKSKLVLTVDAARFGQRLAGRLESLPNQPTDASVGFRDGHPYVIPAKPGITVTWKALAAALSQAITKQGNGRRAKVALVPKPAAFKTADAKALQIEHRVGHFTVVFPASALISANLLFATSSLDGTVLRPGQTLSLNGKVGSDLQTSDLSTALFNAVLLSGFDVGERHAGTSYVNRYPAGRDAAVGSGRDFSFANDSEYGVLVRSWVVQTDPSLPGEVVVELWSTQSWRIKMTTSERYAVTQPTVSRVRGPRCVPQIGVTGFSVDLFQHYYERKNFVRTETIHSEYAGSDTVVCVRR